MTNNPWVPGEYFISSANGPEKVSGYLWRGLCLGRHGWGIPRSKRRWTLTHFGSGGCVTQFIGDDETVFPVASEIAKCSDWTLFDLVNGWKQTDPDLPAKVEAILRAHPETQPGISEACEFQTDEESRAVILARENPA